jgi:hypothetical protein
VVGAEADAQRVEDSLHGAYGWRWAAHVFEQDQPPAGAQDAVRLGHGRVVIGDRAQAERDEHRVEAVVFQLERLGVADAQVDVAPELLGPLFGDLQHPRAELDPGQPNVGGVVRQIAPGSDCELEDLAGDL